MACGRRVAIFTTATLSNLQKTPGPLHTKRGKRLHGSTGHQVSAQMRRRLACGGLPDGIWRIIYEVRGECAERQVSAPRPAISICAPPSEMQSNVRFSGHL